MPLGVGVGGVDGGGPDPDRPRLARALGPREELPLRARVLKRVPVFILLGRGDEG